jgi:hypothetical protein
VATPSRRQEHHQTFVLVAESRQSRLICEHGAFTDTALRQEYFVALLSILNNRKKLVSSTSTNNVYTSSMMAILALSPWRATVLKTRV